MIYLLKFHLCVCEVRVWMQVSDDHGVHKPQCVAVAQKTYLFVALVLSVPIYIVSMNQSKVVGLARQVFLPADSSLHTLFLFLSFLWGN